jgi:hypothetical protein
LQSEESALEKDLDVEQLHLSVFVYCNKVGKQHPKVISGRVKLDHGEGKSQAEVEEGETC